MSIKCVYDQKVLLLSLSMHWIAVTAEAVYANAKSIHEIIPLLLLRTRLRKAVLHVKLLS